MTQATQKLDAKAASIAGDLSDKLLAPFSAALATFEGAFPGITERLTAVIDPAKLKAAFSTEVAQSITALMEEGTEASLTAAVGKVKELRGLLAQGPALTQEETRALITKAGGIFIGKEELIKLEKLAPDAVIPEIPAKYSQAFLESTHPLRGGSIASRIIIAFDPQSNQWHTVDRGEGGKSDIVPGSLGKDGRGLSGDKQDELLKKDGAQIKVEGVEISPHKDSSPIERILDNAVALHLAADKSIDTAPFRDIYGRTGDTQRGASGCRVLLGHSHGNGVDVYVGYHSDDANDGVGLLAGWN
jgi:hypothetical protein